MQNAICDFSLWAWLLINSSHRALFISFVLLMHTASQHPSPSVQFTADNWIAWTVLCASMFLQIYKYLILWFTICNMPCLCQVKCVEFLPVWLLFFVSVLKPYIISLITVMSQENYFILTMLIGCFWKYNPCTKQFLNYYMIYSCENVL